MSCTDCVHFSSVYLGTENGGSYKLYCHSFNCDLRYGCVSDCTDFKPKKSVVKAERKEARKRKLEMVYSEMESLG